MSVGKFLLRVGPFCSALLIGAAGCTPATPPGTTASASSTDQVTASVVAVDQGRRSVTLKSPDGQVGTVYVPDTVRNFDRIAVGDTVNMTLHSRVDVTVSGGGAIPGVIVDQGVARAPKGARPAAIWTSRTQRSVQIISVDKVGHTVTFREPDGSIDSFTVQNPANYAIADGLQPGSYVTVVGTDAVAVSVDKM